MVRPKKHLGQHFLKDENIARKIVSCLDPACGLVLEVGPGMGVLSKYILEKRETASAGMVLDPWFIEVDTESVEYLRSRYPSIGERLINADFLRYDFTGFPPGSAEGNPQAMLRKFSVIGNFPYNISSQILFAVLEQRHRVTEVVGMFQKEVAERIAARPGSKTYGILSVLMQAYYDIEYLFTVNETVFHPPPKVKSAVIRLRRNNKEKLDCDEALFKTVVKTAFNQRRKTLRNALKPLLKDGTLSGSPHPVGVPPPRQGPPTPSGSPHPVRVQSLPGLPGLLDLRAEQLSVSDFVSLATELSTFA